MSFHEDLAQAIISKYLGARKDLIKEGIDPGLITGVGCGVVAWDGYLRGCLTQDMYKGHLRIYAEGGVFTYYQVIEMALGVTKIFRDLLGDRYPPDAGVRVYSSSPEATGRNDLIPKPLSRKEALILAKDIREVRTLGVFINTEVKVKRRGHRIKKEVKVRGHIKTERRGHIFSLIGEGGAILRVDGAKQKGVYCLSDRKAADLMRRGNHGGLVIDIR